MAKSPSFQFYVRDWLCSLTVQRMTGEQVKAYMYLMASSWLEHPRASLPNNDEELSALSRLNIETWIRIKGGIMKAFYLKENRWYSEKLLEVSEIQYKNSKHGKLGGNPIFNKGKHNPYHKPNDKPTYKPIDKHSSSSSTSSSFNTNTSKIYKTPILDEVIAYFTNNGYSEESARRAYEHYTLGDWHDTNGVKVRRWKQKMHTVWFKEENKINSNLSKMVR